MITAVDITAARAGRPMLRGRSAQTPDAEARAAFAVLAPFGEGSIFAGSFSGDARWERHAGGDELRPRAGRRRVALRGRGRRR